VMGINRPKTIPAPEDDSVNPLYMQMSVIYTISEN